MPKEEDGDQWTFVDRKTKKKNQRSLMICEVKVEDVKQEVTAMEDID